MALNFIIKCQVTNVIGKVLSIQILQNTDRINDSVLLMVDEVKEE